MIVIEDNYLQKFYRRNTNLSEITTNKNINHKSLLRFIELGEKEVFFLWVASNILIWNILL
jgi:hypothetical protein